MTPSNSAGRAKSTTSSSRIVTVRLELTPVAKQQTVAVADRFGMTQIAALSRLVEWFSGQPEAVQHAVLSVQDDGSAKPDVARLILERMAGSDEPHTE